MTRNDYEKLMGYVVELETLLFRVAMESGKSMAVRDYIRKVGVSAQHQAMLTETANRPEQENGS